MPKQIAFYLLTLGLTHDDEDLILSGSVPRYTFEKFELSIENKTLPKYCNKIPKIKIMAVVMGMGFPLFLTMD